MLRVAVKLPATIDDVGEYLADVTALEAAGVATIWVDDTGLEPWVVLGAMAAVTHRVGLGCLFTSLDRWPPSRLSPSAAALQKLSRGRVVVGLPSHAKLRNHIEALRAAEARIFTAGSPKETADGVIFNVESADQISGATDTDVEVWASIAMPPDREAWAGALGGYGAAGATGVIVPWNARLIDLLRNSEPDDRTDLLISTG